MPVAHVGTSVPAGNPTTGFTLTIHASTLAGHDVFLLLTSRDHTAATAYPTVTDNDTGGNAWARVGESADRKLTLWWKKATATTAGKTVTAAACVGSSAGVCSTFGGTGAGPAYKNIGAESNASGDESHAGFVPTRADSMVVLGVANTANDNTVTTPACTNPGALAIRGQKLSTGGNDCAAMLASALQSGGPTTTGNFTWAQTNGTTASVVFTISPPQAVAANPGAHALAGTAATPRAGRRLVAAGGTHDVTGTTATLSQGQGLTHYTVPAATGAHTLVGTAAGVRTTRRVQCAAGVVDAVGTPAIIRHGARVGATTGGVVTTGTTAGARVTRRVVATPGAHTAAGTAATLLHDIVSFTLVAVAGAVDIGDSPCWLCTARRVRNTPPPPITTVAPARRGWGGW